MIYRLVHAEARKRAIQGVQDAPEGMVVTIKEQGRNLEQSALFHALCDDAAKAGIVWFGKPRTAAQWKVLFISGHAAATGLGADVIPGLEGEFINVRESSASMTKSRISSVIEYAKAFLAEHQK
jgi:hypothetical protein